MGDKEERERGIRDGLKADAGDQVCHSLSRAFNNSSYNSGFDEGVDSKPSSSGSNSGSNSSSSSSGWDSFWGSSSSSGSNESSSDDNSDSSPSPSYSGGGGGGGSGGGSGGSRTSNDDGAGCLGCLGLLILLGVGYIGYRALGSGSQGVVAPTANVRPEMTAEERLRIEVNREMEEAMKAPNARSDQNQDYSNKSGRYKERPRGMSLEQRLQNSYSLSKDEGLDDLFDVNNRSISKNERGDIKNIRIVYDALEGDTKGMRFYIDFTAWNAGGRTFLPCVFFYDEDGHKLMDADNLFRAGDGQVFTHGKKLTANATWAGSNWSDCSMFIPLKQLDIREPGKYNLNYHVEIFDVTNPDKPVSVTTSKEYCFEYSLGSAK